MSDKSLLHVPVVALAFQPGPEALETMQIARSLDPKALFWAVMTKDDVPAMRSLWKDDGNSALLIAWSSPEKAIETACDLLSLVPSVPTALLLANAPPQRGFFKSKRHLDEVVRRLHSGHADLQVHVYTSDWSRRPPRLR